MPDGNRSRASRLTRAVQIEGVLFLLGLLAAWQIAVATGAVESQFLPSPQEIARAAGELISSGEMGSNLLHTVYVTLLGWAISGALGVIIGLALGLSSALWRYSMASVEFLRALPGISFVPVAVLLLGFSVRMELVVVVYVSVWPVLVNTVYGARCVTPLHGDVARMMRMSTLTRIRRFVLPTTAPYVLVGLQVSLSLALALALVAEMVGNPAGVGQALILAQNTLQPADMFAYVIVIGVVGVLLNAAFLRLAGLAFPGTLSTARAGR